MKVVDLFCGCGGMSLGFSLAGHEVLAGFDNWDKAIDVYKKNFKHPVFKTDLKDVDASVAAIEPFAPDVIIGGPPCQDFSSAGKRDEDNGRGDLTVCYAKIIAKVKPKWFVMENVARIVKTQKLVDAKKIFAKAGYGMTQYVLDASLCGVPQVRKRFVLVGMLGAEDDFLLPFIEKNLSEKPLTVAEYFGKDLDIKYYYRHPRSYVRRGIFSVDEPSPTIRGVNRPLPKGYPLHPGDAVQSLKGVRPLTTEERSRIQTFPKNFSFIGSKTDQEQMIGNAVPVNLGKFVGIAIDEYFRTMDENGKTSIEKIGMMGKEFWHGKNVQLRLFEKREKYSV
ncbi:MAG: DNA cytosine methyltransferase [Fibrobacteraceae bacterium]|nr:DNA cytosine methyltransferase [Fibrobacteraceae bacterium]